MSISAEEKNRYLREVAIVLAREGFQTDRTHTGGLHVLLDGSPLCEVTESGGVTYRNEDIDEPERIAAKDKVYEIVRTTAEYMRQMEMVPFLKADGLEDGYKVLADFNGTVLAGVQSKHGVHFVTWDWAYGHTGVAVADSFPNSAVLLVAVGGTSVSVVLSAGGSFMLLAVLPVREVGAAGVGAGALWFLWQCFTSTGHKKSPHRIAPMKAVLYLLCLAL